MSPNSSQWIVPSEVSIVAASLVPLPWSCLTYSARSLATGARTVMSPLVVAPFASVPVASITGVPPALALPLPALPALPVASAALPLGLFAAARAAGEGSGLG